MSEPTLQQLKDAIDVASDVSAGTHLQRRVAKVRARHSTINVKVWDKLESALKKRTGLELSLQILNDGGKGFIEDSKTIVMVRLPGDCTMEAVVDLFFGKKTVDTTSPVDRQGVATE